MALHATRKWREALFFGSWKQKQKRADTLARLAKEEQRATVKAYQTAAAMKSDLERTELQKEKSGVFTGGFAINPVNGQSIPVWVADYVLGHYGTGAIMAVPAHDNRDYEYHCSLELPKW